MTTLICILVNNVRVFLHFYYGRFGIGCTLFYTVRSVATFPYISFVCLLHAMEVIRKFHFIRYFQLRFSQTFISQLSIAVNIAVIHFVHLKVKLNCN